MFKLVIQDDEGKTTVVPLIRDEITIGRKEGNTIRLTERNVSRRHARILRNNGEVQIEDLGSYNGIRVNNARIAERVSLRISDQVQIGDYKLYLKAEGVEQVDDARTMPIERIENAPATEVMPAVQAPVAAPTAPMPAQAPPPSVSATGPQRAIPPTPEVDPGGRPVATAAQVAALTQPAAYGKLAIVSSNFAGKEFDLTRPQMIIGRTDENDIVIPHRSISRNHAKITRDPETQRYTIGDLQSSNGVRVNGQDYSKVELRRGDIVDLGHVRLRFIEPGEDFVFERDARIEDVEPPSAKRGLLVAAVLAVLVLGGVAAFLFVRSQHQSANGGVTGDKGSAADVASTGSASNPVATTTPLDAGGSAAVAMVGSNPGSDTQSGSDTAKSRKLAECHGLQADRKWNDLQHCAEELRALDAADADTLAKQATAEAGAEKTSAALEQALGDRNMSRARKLLDKIQPDSVYREKAQNDYEAAEDTELTRQAQDLARAHKCGEIDTLAGRALSDDLATKLRAIPCEVPVAVVPIDCSSSLKDQNDKRCLRQFCSGHPGDGRCPSSAQPACNPEPFTAEGRQKYETGDYHGAMASYDQALSCHYDANTNKLAFIAACNARDAGKAKGYYRRLSSSDKHSSLLQSCVKQGITEDLLKQ